jgi:hypothetical protein
MFRVVEVGTPVAQRPPHGSRQALNALTFSGVSVLGSGTLTPSPLASAAFEAELLKPDANPACGSRFSLGTLLDGRSTR